MIHKMWLGLALACPPFAVVCSAQSAQPAQPAQPTPRAGTNLTNPANATNKAASGSGQTLPSDGTPESDKTRTPEGASAVLISEVRVFGPRGGEDAFVEVRNGKDEPFDLSGWTLQYLNSAQRLVTVPVPRGVTLPERGSLLFVGKQYSLPAYAAGDLRLEEGVHSGVLLCDPQGKIVDAVGPTPVTAPQLPGLLAPQASGRAFHEGRGLPRFAFAVPTSTVSGATSKTVEPAKNANGAPSPGAATTRQTTGTAQFSLVRRTRNGQLQDTNDNAADFVIVSVTGQLSGRSVRLGAPSPQNLLASSLVLPAAESSAPDDGVAGTAVQPVSAGTSAASSGRTSAGSPAQSTAGTRPPGTQPPGTTTPPALRADARRPGSRLTPLRDGSATGTNRRYGTLLLRREITNRSGRPIHRFRFQVVGITAGEITRDVADVRLLAAPEVRSLANRQTGLPPTPAGDAKDGAKNGATSGRLTPARVFAVLDEPPAQKSGGALNSSLTCEVQPGGVAPGAVAPSAVGPSAVGPGAVGPSAVGPGAIVPGESVEVCFLLGVERRGRYRVVLESGGALLTFDGHTEKPASDASATLVWSERSGAAHSGQVAQQNASSGPNVSASAGPGSANASGASSNEKETLVASIVFEGNTDDIFGPAQVARSPLQLSSYALGDASSIRLRFSGPLDPQSAGDIARYSVTINGEAAPIQSVSYTAGQDSVLLSLTEGALRPGDTVVVSWSDLRDAQGRQVTGQIGPIEVR